MNQKIILVGKGASGKDCLRKRFEAKGWKYSKSYTTRPMRKNEKNDGDYVFISVQEFKSMIEKGEFVEWCMFNDWYYGTPKKEWEESNLLIVTPSGLKQIKEKMNLENVFVFFLDIDYETRYKRLSSRMDADKPDRRIKADEEDFMGFKEYDCVIKNPDF